MLYKTGVYGWIPLKLLDARAFAGLKNVHNVQYIITLHCSGEPRMDGLWPCAEYVQWWSRDCFSLDITQVLFCLFSISTRVLFIHFFFHWNVVQVLSRFAFVSSISLKHLCSQFWRAILQEEVVERDGRAKVSDLEYYEYVISWSVLSRLWRNVPGRSLRLMEESILKTSVECALPSLPLGFLLFKILIIIVNTHRPRSEIKYQQKTDSGEVFNLFLSKDHKTTLTFCQVIILLYTSSRLTKSSTLLSAPILASRIYTSPFHWKLTDIFFPIWILWGRCEQWLLMIM